MAVVHRGSCLSSSMAALLPMPGCSFFSYLFVVVVWWVFVVVGFGFFPPRVCPCGKHYMCVSEH